MHLLVRPVILLYLPFFHRHRHFLYSRHNLRSARTGNKTFFYSALYVENDGIWEGGSTSQFTPVMKFKLWERFSETGLEVAESMEVNGKRTFGYDIPILYKRA